MTWPTPYVLLPGTAREALSFYAEVFGGTLVLNTYDDFGRTDGPGDAIAHGVLQGTVSFFAADAAGEDTPLHTSGLMHSLLGAADPDTTRSWFAALSEGGTVVDDLQVRPWGASDGQVIDRFGMHWLLGFEPQD
jgi:PhnB protein